MKRILVVIVALLVIASCRTVDPAAKARADALLAVTGSGASIDNGPRTPWKVGQWARYRTRTNDDVGAVEYRVTGEEDGAFWMDIESADSYSQSKQRWLVSGFDPNDITSMRALRLERMVMYDQEGKPLPTPSFLTGMVNSTLRSMIFELREDGAERVTVPAGTFNCAKDTTTVTIFGITRESEVWVSGGAPIWALVKSVATDGSHEMELIAFGEDEAQP